MIDLDQYRAQAPVEHSYEFHPPCDDLSLELLPRWAALEHAAPIHMTELRSVGLATTLLVASCTTPMPAAGGPTVEGSLPGEGAPMQSLTSVDRSSPKEPSPLNLPAPAPGREPAGSKNLLDAAGAAVTRPFRALAQTIDPERLAASAERGIARAIVRAARRQAAIEAESTAALSPSETGLENAQLSQFDDPMPLTFYGLADASLRFAPVRPSIEGLGIVPLADPDWAPLPLRIDVRVPSGSHFRRAVDNDERWRDVIRQVEYKVTFDLSNHRDTVAILIEPDAVRIFFCHPIYSR